MYFVFHAIREIQFKIISCLYKAYRIRTEFLKAILRQDISWFDTTTTTDFATKMTELVYIYDFYNL